MTKAKVPFRTSALGAVAMLVVGVAPVEQALAANCVWNPVTGNWGSSGNWSCGIVPTGPSLDSATIGAGKIVTINSAQSIFTLGNAGRIDIDTFLLSLQGSGSTVNTGIINVGGAGTAALQVSAGHNIDNTGGVINVANGSTVNQFGSTIGGGTINTTGTGALVVFNNGTNVLSGVTLNGTMDMATNGNSRQRIVNGATLNGAVNIANGGILSLDSATTSGGAQTIGGSGSINLNDVGARLAIDGTGTTTLGANIVVRGQGNIGQALNAGGNNVLTNNGLISADVSGGTLTLSAPASGGGSSVVNNGTLQAVGGGSLVLSTNIASGSGSQIVAGAGSTVVQSGVRLNGVINVSGTGTFQVTNSSANFLDGLNLTGALDLASYGNARERIINGATLNGAVNIANGGILSLDSASGAASQTLSGTAVINLNDAGARLAIDGTGTTTLGANITVRGRGDIGTPINSGGNNVLTNNGLISADVNGGTLNIAAPAGGGGSSFVNNGTLRAINGGSLVLSTNIASSSGSQIVAGAGSTVVQSGVKLNGVINVSGTGTFQATNSGGGNFLDGVTFTGALDLSSFGNARERIINNATLTGAVNIANGGILSLDSAAGAASQALSGTAVINLNDAGARLAIDGTGTTTLGANITVRGQGDIGTPINSGGNNVLTNNGLISADVNGGTLNIAAPAGGGGSSFVNNGTLQAVGGGRLLLSTNILSNPGGQIVAGAGSAVIQSGVTVNGVVTASGSGVVTMSNSSANFLNGVVFTGTLDMGSNGNSRERIINGATINGAVNIANGGILSLDNTNTAGNNQTIGGSAVINLNDGGARLAVDGTGTTTLGSNVTVRGQGNIGQALNTGGNTTLVINGLVSADVSGGTLNITPPASGGGSLLVNHNILQATGGGTLQLSTNIDNTGGQIRALTGSQVVQSGVTVTGGVIASSGTGSFLVASNGGNFLSGVTVTGLVDMTTIGNSRNRIINGGTINGAVNIGSGGILSLDSTNTAGNAQTVGGTGVINLTDSTARLAIDGTGTTTLAAGLLVRGQGNIGQAVNDGGNHTLISNATILADGGTLHVTAPASGGASVLAGAGTLQTSGGTLDLNTSTASTQGQLVMGGTGSALNLNSQNLTITIDYTNAQSGTGNAFDRRAGVSGTGQILAGANAAQAITGANVSNGSSPNATLSIGNLRVGSTSYTYRIANTGTTGPILRGAIQTSVNGANITDARLSGSGVTAANYSAGAPGGNSGDQTITFTANSAGALAPLTGQVLNLRSNFDNIPDQKLNIVVAAGAGAYSIATGAAAPAPVTIVNQRVGGTQAQALTISNTAAAGSFTEALNASFGSLTGAATHNGGSIAGGLGAGGVAAGGPANTTAMSVGVDTSSAGLKSGTVTLDYQSNGAGSSGLATIASNSQTVNVSGKVYQVASGALLTAPLNFGTVQVGQNVSQVLSITNSATGASGFVEDLNARFGASSGLGAAQISGTGSIIGLAAGATNASALTVGVNTATAGTINGAIAVNYFSAGTVGGVSNGLGEVGVGSSNYGVSGVIQTVGQVINQASPLLNTPTINLGNVRIGSTSPTQFVSIGNQSVGSPQAALNASISANAPISASGSFNLLAPGATNNTSLQVGINTANAGAISGQATIALVSDASNVGGCEPNCQLTLASKTVDVTGAVYRLASPSITSGPIGLAARVGDLAPTAGIGVTNVSPDAFTERLNASIGSAPAGFVGTGSISGLVAGASSSALGVTLNTTTAGSFGGQAGVAFVSSGAGTTNAADLSVGTQNVALSGHVYAPAAAHVGTTTVDFGIVHKGDSVAARNVAVTNSAGPAALNDTLNGSLGGASGPFTAVGTIVGLAPGNTDTTSFLVGMNTANAGVFAGGASAAFASHNPELVDLPLGAVALTVKGQVNNFAELALGKVSGSGGLTHSGSTYTLDFGSVQFGSLDLGAGLAIVNGAAGPADLLSGSFTIGTGTGFTLGGFDSFAGIAAGASLAGLTVGFGTDVLGEFTQTITIAASGSNASGFLGGLGDTTLVLRGNVVAVPEPATYLLYASGMLAMWFVSRRRLRDATRR